MTTRRRFLGMVGGTAGAALFGGTAGAVLLGGCDNGRSEDGRSAGGGEPGAPGAVPDLVLVDTATGLATMRGTHRAVHPAGVSTPDAALLYSATHSGGDSGETVVHTIESATGMAVARCLLVGHWVPRVVSPDGGQLALTAPESGDGFRPAGRERTTIVVADRNRERYRIELPGNYQPDAFRAAGQGLFLLDWLPPTAPDRYRVRVLDQGQPAPTPLFTRDKSAVPEGAEEEMRGAGRQAVLSPDRTRLYTLYTHQPEHQHTRDLLTGGRDTAVHAFVHVLNLLDGWAYCLNLPDPFGHGASAGHTLALTPDGRTLLVADTTSGQLVSADTEALTVTRVVPGYTATGPASAAVSPDGRRLYLGGGTAVARVDLAALTVTASWELRQPVRGVALSPDGNRLYVGEPTAVAWYDPTSGARHGHVDVAGVRELRQVA